MDENKLKNFSIKELRKELANRSVTKANTLRSVTKKEFLAYENVREEGETNMFDTAFVQVLSEKFIVPRLSQAKILVIIENYSDLKKLHTRTD